MPAKKCRNTLTEVEREALNAAAHSKNSTKTIRVRASVLLMADEGCAGPGFKDDDIASALDCSVVTVSRARRKCCELGPSGAVERKKCAPRPHRRKLDGRGEATLVATACSEPPEGASGWSLTLLADRLVELGATDEISRETVRRTLKKMSSSPG
jgi:hypothetical protein